MSKKQLILDQIQKGNLLLDQIVEETSVSRDYALEVLKSEKYYLFSFKTSHPEGKYRSFFKKSHNILIKKVDVGNIIEEENVFTIRLMVDKEDVENSSNPNCSWEWIQLKGRFDSLDNTKEFLQTRCKTLLEKYNIITTS